MRINNKYIRNQSVKNKQWNKIRSKSHPFRTSLNPPYCKQTSVEEQIESNFDWIQTQARSLDNGSPRSFNHAPKQFRKILNDKRKAKERQYLNKIRHGNDEAETPHFKRDADWLWF